MSLENAAATVCGGQEVTFKPRGNSMVPIVRSGQEVTVEPVLGENLRVGDVVLCKVSGHIYLHKITAIDTGQRRVQIGNNKGRINGWTPYEHVYGRKR